VVLVPERRLGCQRLMRGGFRAALRVAGVVLCFSERAALSAGVRVMRGGSRDSGLSATSGALLKRQIKPAWIRGLFPAADMQYRRTGSRRCVIPGGRSEGPSEPGPRAPPSRVTGYYPVTKALRVMAAWLRGTGVH